MAERSQDELGPPERPIGDHILKGILWGTLSGWLIVFVPYLIVLILKSRGLSHLWAGLPTEGSSLIYVYNVSLLLVMPLIQGLFGGVVRGREKQAVGSGIVVIAAITAVDIFVAFVFLREGGICILMASPLLAAILAIGYVIGRRLARVRRSRKVSMSLIPLVVVAVIGETTGPAPNYPAVVTDEVTVNAPPEYVWRYIVDYPDNPNPPKYWLWQMGLPAPTHSVAHVQEVDARRDCKFSGSQVFEERIAVLEPNKSWFSISPNNRIIRKSSVISRLIAAKWFCAKTPIIPRQLSPPVITGCTSVLRPILPGGQRMLRAISISA